MLDKDRIESILEVLLQYTIKDFDKSIPISDAGDEIDAIAVGVNTMGEELDLTLNNIQQANKDLIKKNKELEQFTYIASHDLQEPLLTIKNYTKLLKEEYNEKLDDEGKLFLRFISEASIRMSMLVKGLLDYSTIGNYSEFASVSSKAIILASIEKVKLKYSNESIDFKVLNTPEVFVHENDFSKLLYNLIDNALKYRNTTIQTKIEIGCTESNDLWEFYVKDNGIGIPASQFERIFIIFQRLHGKTEYSGTGIGLALCRKIIELHQGSMWVESEVGVGSTFYFTIKK